MGFALIFIGVLLTVSAVRGTYHDLFTLIKGDFTGPGNFLYWILVIAIVGGIGYIKAIQPLSRAFLALIVLVILLVKGNPGAFGGGFFTQLLNQVGTTTAPSATAPSGASNPLAGILPTLPLFN